MTRLGLAFLLALLHFACPLLFFTDLTRNPYVTQIVLLNIGVLAAFCLAAAERGEGWPKTPLDAPWALWLGLCAASWAFAYAGHVPFFRPSMRSEGLRVFLFTLVNAFGVYQLAALCAGRSGEDAERPGLFAPLLLWGACWLAFSRLRSAPSSPLDVLGHVWDGYGGLLWGAALAGLLLFLRSGGTHTLWHAALGAGFLGSLYGVCQYFGWELIWPKTLNPYGGRSVSTFGNPNFMSSYMVILLPLAAAYFLKARTRARQLVYGAVLLALEACLLCSLTRSSWLGAAAGLGVLAFSATLRREAARDLKALGLLSACAAAMALCWPQSAVEGFTPSVLGRLAELSRIADAGAEVPYSPWYQRTLIWTCAWLMGAENPLLGKGWGLFELFYPFYQGPIVNAFDFFRSMRTHANNAHNEIMEVWAQTGILGLGALALFWGVFFRSVLSAVRSLEAAPAKSPPVYQDPVWILAPAAGVAGMLADNLLNVSLHFAVPAFLFWWQAGTAMGLLARAQRWERPWPSAAFRRAFLGVLAACALLGSRHWVRCWNREVQYFLGFKLMRSGHAQAAVQRLEAAHRWHPREVNANYELANALVRVEKFPEAVRAYREALDSNAGYDEIYFNLAVILVNRMGDEEGARRNFLTALLINPISQDLYGNFSAFYLREPLKYREACIRLLERAAHFFPENPGFLNNLGYLYTLGGEHARAEALYARALAFNPDAPLAEANLLGSLARSKNPEPRVLSGVRRFRALQERLREKDYGAGTLALARSVQADFPDDLNANFYLGNLALIHGQAEDGVLFLRKALRRQPSHVGVLLNLAQGLKKLGRLGEARERLLDALKADPGNAAAQRELQALGH